jgi:hypothetical protein
MMTIEQGIIVCSIVLESEPTVLKYSDIVNIVTNMNSRYVKKALAVLLRLVMKYNATLNITQVAILLGRSHMSDAKLSVHGW